MPSRSRCAALAACVTAFAVPAMAGPPPTTGDVILAKINDTELNSVHATQSLASRVEAGATFVCVSDSLIVSRGLDDVPYREAAVDRDLTPLKPPCSSTGLVCLPPAGFSSVQRRLAPDPRRKEAGIGRSGSVRGPAYNPTVRVKRPAAVMGRTAITNA